MKDYGFKTSPKKATVSKGSSPYEVRKPQATHLVGCTQVIENRGPVAYLAMAICAGNKGQITQIMSRICTRDNTYLTWPNHDFCAGCMLEANASRARGDMCAYSPGWTGTRKASPRVLDRPA